jgi:hypothetical protein
MKYEVGQKLVAVYTLNRKDPAIYPATLTKIGRKWVHFETERNGTDRFDPDGGWIDGGQYTSPGKVYPSKEAYELEVTRNEAWDRLRKVVSAEWSCPGYVTLKEVEDMVGLIEGPRRDA